MSQFRVEGGTHTTTVEPRVVGAGQLQELRRRRSLPRALVARAGACTARTKKTSLVRQPPPYDPRLIGVHDFGDGRHAIEFEGPSLDLMLYHDRGMTIAEWVTVDGDLVSLAIVGDC